MFRANRMAVASVPFRRGGPWPSRGGGTAGQGPDFEIANVRRAGTPALQNGRNGVANRGTRAAAGSSGRIGSPPLRPTAGAANRKTAVPMAPQTYVGDDACIVPGTPRRRGVPRADMESAPTNGSEARSNRETAVTAAMANPCRGRFNIGPVCGGTGFRGRGVPLPCKPWRTPNQTRWPRPSGQP